MEEKNYADTLGKAFGLYIEKNYANVITPEPIITPTGIRHLDALLGGGIVSSGPVLLSSTPETGKSTFAFQFSSIFQKHYENSIIVYIDIESAGTKSNEYRVSRIDTFGLNNDRFRYQSMTMDVLTLFDLFDKIIKLKIQAEEKLGKEFYVLIVWDSIASTPSSKTAAAENPDKIIGTKARQISFCLDKYMPIFKFNKITFIGIDQVRADLKIEGPYAPRNEISVGRFKNRDIKAASNIYQLQHSVQQWLFLSRGSAITSTDGFGIDGWYVEIYSEKNKLAPSQNSINCIFSKSHGIDKFWSEYVFLQEKTPTEKKIYKEDKKLPFPLMIKTSGSYNYLDVLDPNNPEVKYTSTKFYRKDAKKKYESDEEFRNWFEYALNLSVQNRIINSMFKTVPVSSDVDDNSELDENSEFISTLETSFES